MGRALYGLRGSSSSEPDGAALHDGILSGLHHGRELEENPLPTGWDTPSAHGKRHARGSRATYNKEPGAPGHLAHRYFAMTSVHRARTSDTTMKDVCGPGAFVSSPRARWRFAVDAVMRTVCARLRGERSTWTPTSGSRGKHRASRPEILESMSGRTRGYTWGACPRWKSRWKPAGCS